MITRRALQAALFGVAIAVVLLLRPPLPADGQVPPGEQGNFDTLMQALIAAGFCVCEMDDTTVIGFDPDALRLGPDYSAAEKRTALDAIRAALEAFRNAPRAGNSRVEFAGTFEISLCEGSGEPGTRTITVRVVFDPAPSNPSEARASGGEDLVIAIAGNGVSDGTAHNGHDARANRQGGPSGRHGTAIALGGNGAEATSGETANGGDGGDAWAGLAREAPEPCDGRHGPAALAFGGHGGDDQGAQGAETKNGGDGGEAHSQTKDAIGLTQGGNGGLSAPRNSCGGRGGSAHAEDRAGGAGGGGGQNGVASSQRGTQSGSAATDRGLGSAGSMVERAPGKRDRETSGHVNDLHPTDEGDDCD